MSILSHFSWSLVQIFQCIAEHQNLLQLAEFSNQDSEYAYEKIRMLRPQFKRFLFINLPKS